MVLKLIVYGLIVFAVSLMLAWFLLSTFQDHDWEI